MAKPKLFIGASLENQQVASALQQELDYDVEPEIWHQGTFRPTEYPLESLESMLGRADFAAFIISPDDVTFSRDKELNTVRDNVIFEFGLFVGKLGRKRVFLVAPRDTKLDLPSDLTNLTPLTYDPARDNLRSALGSAASEIRAAIKRVGAIARPATEVATQELSESSESHSSRWYAEVEPSWKLNDYSHNYFVAVVLDDGEAAAKIQAAFQATSPSEEDRAVWESESDWTHLLDGQHRSLEAFRARAEAHPQNAALALRYASALDHYGNKPMAVERLLALADSATDVDVVADAVDRANSIVGLNAELIDRYRKRLLERPEGTSSDAVLRTLSKLARAANLNLTARGIDEIRLRHAPDDTELRFQLAYQYGDDDRNALAFLHYRSIPTTLRSAVAWNNLGVAYGNLGMPGRSISAFEQASEKGETLADANIAQKLLNTGFEEQAKSRLQKAVSVPNHHENVVAGLAAITSAQANEKAKEMEVLSEAQSLQEIELGIGGRALEKQEMPFEGAWETSEAIVHVELLADGLYEARGKYSRKVPSGGMMLFGGERLEEVDLVYKLKRFGNLLEGTVSRTVDGAPVGNSLFMMLSAGEQAVTVSVDSNSAHEVERDRNFRAVWKPVPRQLASSIEATPANDKA